MIGSAANVRYLMKLFYLFIFLTRIRTTSPKQVTFLPLQDRARLSKIRAERLTMDYQDRSIYSQINGLIHKGCCASRTVDRSQWGLEDRPGSDMYQPGSSWVKKTMTIQIPSSSQDRVRQLSTAPASSQKKWEVPAVECLRGQTSSTKKLSKSSPRTNSKS